MSNERRRRHQQPAQPLSATLLISLALLACCCAFLIYSGLRMLPASINYFQAGLFLKDWDKHKQQPSAKAWEIAHTAAQKAVDLYPTTHGRYYSQLGYVLQWHDFTKPYGDPSAQQTRTAALEAHRHAVQGRPTWPFAYLDVAWSKLALHEFDQEFTDALANAARYGHSRVGVNRSIAEIGLFAWPYISAEQRQVTLQAVHRTVSLSPREGLVLSRAATHMGLLKELCQAAPQPLWGSHKVCVNQDI